VGSKIDLYDIVLFENSEIARIWCVVGSAVVNADASWESLTGLNLVRFNQTKVGLLDLIANIDQSHPWLDDGLNMPPHLSMALC
jgi:hypothetical protein